MGFTKKQAIAINKGRKKKGLKEIAFKVLKKSKSAAKKVTKTATNKRKSNKSKSLAKAKLRRPTRKTGSTIIRLFRDAAKGIGGGAIGETIAVTAGQPQFASIGGYGGAYLMGGVKGLVGKLAFDLITGRGLSFGNFGTSQSVEAAV